jgi:hypothetical protein
VVQFDFAQMDKPLTFAMSEQSRNIHTVALEAEGTLSTWTFVLASDIHWDSPCCDREKWDRTLRDAAANGWGVLMFGDSYDLMAGRYDPRRSRRDVRPEFDHADYLDAVIDGFSDWHNERNQNGNILLLSRGNHEESVRKNCDTDPIARTVALMNRSGPMKTFAGGYGGWVRFCAKVFNQRYSLTLKYFHGSGGASLMSHGGLQVRRHAAVQPDADVVCTGHIHRRWVIPIARERLYVHAKSGPQIIRDTQYHVCCGGMKNEFKDGSEGWSVERDLPPMETGCVLMRLHFVRDQVRGPSTGRSETRYRLAPEFILPT